MVPSAPLSKLAIFTAICGLFAYDGHLAYGRESGPWRAGIGRGGELVQVTQSGKVNDVMKVQHGYMRTHFLCSLRSTLWNVFVAETDLKTERHS